MDNSVLTNKDLIKYYNLIRGGNKTVLTDIDVFNIGVHVMCFDVIPKDYSAFYWTDGLIDITLNGNRYISFPDVVKDSVPSFNEEKGINNNSINFKISNVNTSVRHHALSGLLKDAKVNFTLVILNPYDSTVISSMMMFSGFIDYAQTVADPNATDNDITLYLNSVYKKLDRQPPVIAANSVYQSYYPGDECMSLLGQVNQNQTWKYN